MISGGDLNYLLLVVFRIKVFKRFCDLYCGKVDFSLGEGSLEGVLNIKEGNSIPV